MLNDQLPKYEALFEFTKGVINITNIVIFQESRNNFYTRLIMHV